MASIRSVEGRSGALQAVAPIKRPSMSAAAKAMLARNAGRDRAQAVPKTATQAAQTSTAASRAAVGTSTGADMAARQAGRDAAQAVPKTATQVAQRKAVTIAPTAGSAPTSGGGGSSYKAPTPGSGSTSTTSTSSTSAPTTNVATSAPAPAPTTSSGKGAEISAVASGGKSRSAMRGNRKSKRDNPRAARSTSIDELKKQAARSLGI